VTPVVIGVEEGGGGGGGAVAGDGAISMVAVAGALSGSMLAVAVVLLTPDVRFTSGSITLAATMGGLLLGAGSATEREKDRNGNTS